MRLIDPLLNKHALEATDLNRGRSFTLTDTLGATLLTLSVKEDCTYLLTPVDGLVIELEDGVRIIT